MLEDSNSCPELSVVIPCYNCEKSIQILHKRLIKELDSFGVIYEIVYVNDDSKDNTALILKGIAMKHSGVVAVDLMFNVGQFRALICGLELSRGRFVVTMDDDLQHPPEEISKLYCKIKSNDFDVVIGKYLKKNHSFFRNVGSTFIRRISNNHKANIHTTSFRCLKRAAVDALLMHRTMFPLIGTMIQKTTSRIAHVDVEHHPRKQGRSNYSVIKLFRTALDRLFNYTSLPLKYVSYAGMIISLASFIVALYYLINYIMGNISLPGWTTIVLLLNFYSGVILLSIAVIGEYVIRILNEVKGSPRYCIRSIYRKVE